MLTLNEAYSTLSTRRRYEVWFIRLGLKDGSGAWWLRYLLLNPGRPGCPENAEGMPVQVWATWFPLNGTPKTFIQGFPCEQIELGSRNPFFFNVGENAIGENFCRGALKASGHSIVWDLHYRSTFRFTMSAKGWIGFTRTPHSDAVISGSITLDETRTEGDPLGFGVQGHNCGYRHRKFWAWAHAFFLRTSGGPSTLEALVYEMPFGLIFRKAVLWHDGEQHVFRNLQNLSEEDTPSFQWRFRGSTKDKLSIDATINGSAQVVHTLPYLKTDCSGSFPVMNNSLAKARLFLQRPNGKVETLETPNGAVLERVGSLFR